MDRHGLRQFGGRRLENVHRRAFGNGTRKRMNYRESPPNRRASDLRYALGNRAQSAGLLHIELNSVATPIRQGLQKTEWQSEPGNKLPKFRPVLPIPGNDFVKSTQPGNHVIRMSDPQPVKPCGHNRLGSVCKPRQRHVLPGAPHLREVTSQRFERRQTENKVADCTRPDEETLHHNVESRLLRNESPIVR